jgi:DNA mismatch endonuclease (patch repair protein)
LKKNNEKIYSRDGRAPIPEKESTSKIMSAIKDKNTKPEVLLRQKLRERGIIGYRIHWKKAPGKPDIAFPGKKIAVFVHGCFWHRCPNCSLPVPRTHFDYWNAKFAKNVNRDSKTAQLLADLGWTSIVIWECEIQSDIEKYAQKVIKKIGEFKNQNL